MPKKAQKGPKRPKKAQKGVYGDVIKYNVRTSEPWCQQNIKLILLSRLARHYIWYFNYMNTRVLPQFVTHTTCPVVFLREMIRVVRSRTAQFFHSTSILFITVFLSLPLPLLFFVSELAPGLKIHK
jgi:hypothetical protein